MSSKKFLLLSFVIVLIFTLSACNEEVNNENDLTTVRMTISITPNSVPFIYMAENDLLGENVVFDLSFHKNRQEAVAKITKNDVDFTNLAIQEVAQLYNNDFDMKLLNIAAWGEYQLMARTPLNDISDLVGKDIWLSTRGGPIDLITTVVLENLGLEKDSDVNFKFLAQRELSQMAISGIGDYEYFVLREPFISQAKINNEQISEVLHLGNEWEKIFSHKYPQSGISVMGNFYNQHPELTDLFLEKYLEALEWVKENPSEAAAMATPHMQGLEEEVVLLALKNFDTEIMSLDEAKDSIELYFGYILEFNPEMINNKLPDEGFYVGE
jgi:NitT/TauT family transport system substrate-binding protein